MTNLESIIVSERSQWQKTTHPSISMKCPQKAQIETGSRFSGCRATVGRVAKVGGGDSLG
jgi:hypothetical protein